MHDAAIFVSIEARFRSNSELLQERVTLSEAKRASQASRFIYGQVLSVVTHAQRNRELVVAYLGGRSCPLRQRMHNDFRSA